MHVRFFSTCALTLFHVSITSYNTTVNTVNITNFLRCAGLGYILLITLHTAQAQGYSLPASTTPTTPTSQAPTTEAHPQALGLRHTIRQIPEACVRLEGVFTDSKTTPYNVDVVPISNRCQPRAQFVPYSARSCKSGQWKTQSQIHIPRADCSLCSATITVFTCPNSPPHWQDGRGNIRIYLNPKDPQHQDNIALPLFSAQFFHTDCSCDQGEKHP